jgi:hypothetical protein
MLLAALLAELGLGFGFTTYILQSNKGGGVSHLWPCHLLHKKVSEGKRNFLWKFKYFTMQNYNLLLKKKIL